MKRELLLAHMDAAFRYAELSYCNRLKTGCLIIDAEGELMAMGFNGTPPGWPNVCETPDGLTTLPEVIHAEQNAKDKFLRAGGKMRDAVVIATDSPCPTCAMEMVRARISAVYYRREYRLKEGIERLLQANIKVEQI